MSNLDKVFYPETGTTKGEILDYCARIAPQLIRHAQEPDRNAQTLGRRRRHSR
jgi:DNA primase